MFLYLNSTNFQTMCQKILCIRDRNQPKQQKDALIEWLFLKAWFLCPSSTVLDLIFALLSHETKYDFD